ncbi:hypothetical protein D3C80_1862260 [compost metagenome]
MPAQLAGLQRALQLAAGGQSQEHLRVAPGLLDDEIAGRRHAPQHLAARTRPGGKLGRGSGRTLGASQLQGLFGTQRQGSKSGW